MLNSSFETDHTEIDGELPGDPPRIQQQQDVAGIDEVGEDDIVAAPGNNEREDATPRPQGGNVIAAALRRASITASSEKTKKSSNKNKERTSIAGAIVKLIE